MKTIVVNSVAPTIKDLIEQAAAEPILLRNEAGRTFILSEVDESDAEALALADSRQLQQVIERSRARAQREGWLTTDQLREQLGLT